MSLRFLLTSACLSVSTLPAFAGAAPPGGLLCGPFGPGGTWNLYQTSTVPLTWAKAQELAAATRDPRGGTGKTGHLVAPGSAAENMFVRQFADGRNLWIGLTDSETFVVRKTPAAHSMSPPSASLHRAFGASTFTATTTSRCAVRV